MDNIFEHFAKTGYLHHVYVIEGIHEVVVPVLVPAIESNLGVKAKGNPDFTVTQHESFSIDEARALKEVQMRAAFDGVRKIFIISARSFPPESQNALLKTFEEPTDGTHFFIILPRVEVLLPTLRSRVFVVHGTGKIDSTEANEIAEKFLASTLEDRFALIKKLVEKKDRELFREILDKIEQMLYAQTKGNSDEATMHMFDEIYLTKSYLATRGASPKMLLEHIAMTV